MTTPYYSDERAVLHHGDCLEVLATLPDASVDSVVTDPPYGLGFMGKDWDDLPPGVEWAAECLRVLKPGGHLLAFGGTRTWHRLAVAVEDAGFEMRDSIAWLYAQGFPKSLDVSKAIDKAAGAERAVVGSRTLTGTAASSSAHVGNLAGGSGVGAVKVVDVTAPATPDAEQWQGWGTALKPAFEPIVVARKPLAGTVAQNILTHGTGALNIDATRIETDDDRRRNSRGGDNGLNGEGTFRIRERRVDEQAHTSGRWPANVILDESQAVALDEQSGTSESRIGKPRGAASGDGWGMTATGAEYADSGGASRFFYTAKATSAERPKAGKVAHPTVKPLDLMRWLVRLVTPPGGVVLDPFAGSGTTLEAAIVEGFRCIGIEREADYLPLIDQRIARAHPPLDFTEATRDTAGRKAAYQALDTTLQRAAGLDTFGHNCGCCGRSSAFINDQGRCLAPACRETK